MSDADARAGGPGRLSAVEWTTLGLILALGAALRFQLPGAGYFNMHAARDCFRALELLRGESFPTTGSEMLFGGRTIGGFFYMLLAVPLAISHSPVGITLWAGLLATLALAVCHFALRRVFGVAVGLAATALWAVSPISVVMLRYMWNPSFLPIFSALALLMLVQWRVEGRRWALAGFLIVWALAFQIHFSVYVWLVVLLALRPWRRGLRPGWGPTAVVLPAFALLWGPYVISEITSGGSNITAITGSPTPPQEIWQPAINSTILPQALQHLRVDLHEQTEPQRFCHFVHFMDVLRRGQRSPLDYSVGMGPQMTSQSTPRHTEWLDFARFVEWLTWMQVFLFIIGMLALTAVILGWPRAPAERLRGALFVDPTTSRDVALALWVWLVVPFTILLFLIPRWYGLPQRPIPARYFAVWHPIQYPVMILGLRAITLLVRRGMPERATWRAGLGPVAWTLLTALISAQALLLGLFFLVAANTGVIFTYSGIHDRLICNVGDKMRIAEVLVAERGLNITAFRERFSTDRLYTRWTDQEEHIDFEMRAQPGFLTQPDPPADLHWHLMRIDGGVFPFSRHGIEILHVDDAGALRAVTFRVVSPKIVIPAQLVENPFVW